jgi:hypothetical protein
LHFVSTAFKLVFPSGKPSMPDEKKVDRFKPQQPTIPGVPADKIPKKAASPAHLSPVPATAPPRSPFLWVGLATGAVIVIVVGVAWRAHSSPAKQAAPVAVETPADPAPEPAAKPVERLPVGPGEIATTEELSKAWSAKRFIFRDPVSSQQTPAIAVRLPGGTLWGVSLREPYGNCELDYVTDLQKLRTQYQFRADHPMIVDVCTRTVYDLLRYGSGPNGLVRGEIVSGRAVRPPIGIEINTQGNHVVAVQME